MPWAYRYLSILSSLACVFFLVFALANMGCGWEPPSTLQATVNSGGDGVADLDGDTTSGGYMPEIAYCDSVAGWNDAWAAFEEDVLELVNQNRAMGADCGSEGSFGAAAPLTMHAALRCAARNHSMDMGLRDYLDHTTPEGLGPGDRLDQALYVGSAWGENIAWGYATPEAVVAGWMTSPGHCANIMNAQFTELGVGYYEGNYWTQTFGRP